MLTTSAVRRAKHLTAALLMSGGLVVSGLAASAPASADPGRCGVTVDGPSANGISGYTYYMKNVCSRALKFKVHLETLNKNTDCKRVLSQDYGNFVSPYPDGAWQAVAC